MRYQRISYERSLSNALVTGDYECAVECPKCTEAFSSLHHSTIKVFNRDSEDQTTGLYTELSSNAIETHRILPSGNPSSRRDGLTVRFNCEQCGPNVATLCIAQHKGSTFMYWQIND